VPAGLKARLNSARLALRDTEIQLGFREAEAALMTLREARDTEAERRAADDLEKALRKLRKEKKSH
jgi:hypothetical protein